MSADTWLIVAVTGFLVAGASAIAAAVLFFVLHIRSVVGELSGKTVAREIRTIREKQERFGERGFRSEGADIKRRMQTENGVNPRNSGGKARGLPGTDELASTNKLAVDSAVNATERLPADETTLLQPETTLLQEETTVLASEGTTVLNVSMKDAMEPIRAAFRITRSIIEIHTEEQISVTKE